MVEFLLYHLNTARPDPGARATPAIQLFRHGSLVPRNRSGLTALSQAVEHSEVLCVLNLVIEEEPPHLEKGEAGD